MPPPSDQVDDELAAVGAVLLEDRLLRRVIKRHRNVPGLGLQVPHADSYALTRAQLAELIASDDVPGGLDRLPTRVAVISGVRTALAAGAPAAWREAWRALFHARVHHVLDELGLEAAAIRQRINAIGQTEFDEARLVLRQEDRLLPPADDAEVYVEFVALYLELRHFAPRTLAQTFPVFDQATRARVDATLALDVDAGLVLAASRPARAPAEAAPVEVAPEASLRSIPIQRSARSSSADRSARRSAEVALAKGNSVRAAILSARAGDGDAARAAIDALVARLAKVLGGPVTAGWADILCRVAEAAAAQQVLRYTATARLLFDLQAACVDGERDVEVVDAASWLRSFGQRAIVRKLPATREIRVARRIRAAARKLTRCELDDADDRVALDEIVTGMVDLANARIRTVLRPVIEAALDEVGLRPRHLPGRVAQKKLVDELLDRAIAVGRLSLGNLRDAIAHNDLKLPDLHPTELGRGDQLLRADRMLATELDGVYRRGEIYLRFLQKVSSVLSGLAVGRLLTLYLLLPLVGSFFVIEGLHHMIAPAAKLVGAAPPEISTKESLIGMAIVVFLLLHAAWFRSAALTVARLMGRLLRVIFVDTLVWLWRVPLVRPFTRWLLLPALPALLVWWLVPGLVRWPVAAAVMALLAVMINSALAEELISDWLLRSGRHLARRILPGLVKYALDLFGWLVELVERGIYRIDEALRFRPNQSPVVAVIKGALATIWFAIAYVLRIYVNLLIEPTVNPVKHFPVVTVAAKLILPFIPQMTMAIGAPVSSVFGNAIGTSFGGFTVLVLPGIAGFLAWEFNSNWKLYRENRSEILRPEKIGSHGETMGALLRPGFHSGTLPKLYGRLRRATWKGDERAVARARDGLHHVEEAVWRFADRQLVALLNQDLTFRAGDVEVVRVEVGSNRVRIELRCPTVGAEATTLAIEEQSGWLVASVPSPGWLSGLDDDQRRVFEIALAGFYKLSGVDLVREQLEDVLTRGGLPGVAYDLSDDGLVVWPGPGFECELVYDLRADQLAARVRGPAYAGTPPSFVDQHARFGHEPIKWTVWSTTWEHLALGLQPGPILAGPPLLGGKAAT